MAVVSGCGSSTNSSSPAASSGGSASTQPAGGQLVVLAAASLKKTFTDIGEQFKTDNPGWSVDFTFAGS
jgi:molybdate transport system substrate-binding protein